MKLRHTIAGLAITAGLLTGAATAAPVASADTTQQQVQGFWQFLHDLQQYPYSCTAYHADIVGNGVFGGVQNVTETPVYGGSCLQAFLLVLDNAATFYTVNVNG